jgi:hypothetical protein
MPLGRGGRARLGDRVRLAMLACAGAGASGAGER